ncbi:hypothetical protein P3T23_002040 [Paraburkholderia sp. GAS448]|uniref:hypothetical protein n=1 Tax=Paraburkholderia sp. GAS448 TaxID=3035136 RepID=UPI003D1F9A91
MRPEHLKLAGIVTLVCGAMSSVGAGAASRDSPTIATGRIIPMRNPALDAAANMTDDAAQGSAPVMQGDAPDAVQAQATGVAPEPDAVPVAQGNSAPDVVYAARTAVMSALDAAPAMTDVPDSLRVPDVPVASAQDVEPVISAAPDSTRVPDVSVIAAQDVAPVTGAVPDSARVADTPAVSVQDVAALESAAPDSMRVPDVLVESAPDVAPVMNTVSDSGSVPDVPTVSAHDVAPATNAVPDAARVSALSVKLVVPVISVVPDSGPVSQAPAESVQRAVPVPAVSVVPAFADVPVVPATSARQLTPGDVTTSDVVHALDKQAVSAEVPAPVTASVAAGVVVPDSSPQEVASAKDVAPVAPRASTRVARTVSPTVVSPARIARPATANAAPNVARPTEVASTPAKGDGLLERAALNLKVTMDTAVQSAQRAPSAATGQAADATVDRKSTSPHAAQKHDDADPAWASADLVAVDESHLDNMRGGFDLPSGLVVSFGISRAAFVNGNLVSSTSFNIPNVAQMTPQQAQMLANANNGSLIQNGLNNSVQPGALPGVTGAVIQNTLSNQQIQALTTINTSVNSLAAFKAMNIGSTLNSALMTAVRPR